MILFKVDILKLLLFFSLFNKILFMMHVNLKSFQKAIEERFPGNLLRVYFVASCNEFERAMISDLIVSFLPQGNMALSRFSDDGCPMHELIGAFKSFSLFGGEPIIILDDLDKLKSSDYDLLLNFLSGPCNFGYLILCSSARPKDQLLSRIEKHSLVLDLLFEKPWDKEKRLKEYVEEKCARDKKTISPLALGLLLQKVGTDLAALEHETEKLLCYAKDAAEIDEEAVLKVSTSHLQYTVWQIADAIIWEKEKRFSFDQINSDPAFFYILLSALRYQLQMGWKLVLGKRDFKGPSKAIARKEKIARALGEEYFKKALIELYEIDLLSKSGADSFFALLDVFSEKACHGK